MGWEVKIALSCQSKHGLVGSSAKTRKIFDGGVTGALFWVKNIKVPFVIGHPPPTHQT